MPKTAGQSAPAFGAWLKELRGARTWSLEQAAIQVRKHLERTGLTVPRSLIAKIEAGRVPTWPLLLAFSRIYSVPEAETAARLADALTFPGVEQLRVDPTPPQPDGVLGSDTSSRSPSAAESRGNHGDGTATTSPHQTDTGIDDIVAGGDVAIAAYLRGLSNTIDAPARAMRELASAITRRQVTAPRPHRAVGARDPRRDGR